MQIPRLLYHLLHVRMHFLKLHKDNINLNIIIPSRKASDNSLLLCELGPMSIQSAIIPFY